MISERILYLLELFLSECTGSSAIQCTVLDVKLAEMHDMQMRSLKFRNSIGE